MTDLACRMGVLRRARSLSCAAGGPDPFHYSRLALTSNAWSAGEGWLNTFTSRATRQGYPGSKAAQRRDICVTDNRPLQSRCLSNVRGMVLGNAREKGKTFYLVLSQTPRALYNSSDLFLQTPLTPATHTATFSSFFAIFCSEVLYFHM